MDGTGMLAELLVLRMDVERVCQEAVLDSGDWDAMAVELERIAYGIGVLQVELREVNAVSQAARADTGKVRG